tara:strand:+ start:323 stop:1147 length:825 start_codon:yes stop_codon:yes gene_type:complete
MKRFIIVIFLLFCFNFSSQAFAANGAATVYKVTITKIELCTAAPLANKKDTTCTGATTVGTGNKTFNVASVTAGTQVGSFVSTTGLPIGTTFTHVKPTLTREFTMKGYVDAERVGGQSAGEDDYCFCRTESDSTYNSTTGKYKSLQFGKCEKTAALAAANAEENTFWLQTDTVGGGTTICANAACDSGSNQTTNYSKDITSLTGQYGLAMDDPDVNTKTFTQIYKLESNYTVGITAPKIDIAFGTDTSLYAYEWTDGSCYLDAYYVKSTTTISE